VKSPTEATLTVDSPVGPLGLRASGEWLTGIAFGAAPTAAETAEVAATPPEPLRLTAAQLGEYFAGDRREFELPVRPPTDGLLGRVLGALALVPFGETVSYGELTRAAGLGTDRVRDVGAALGRNPLAIVLPCHRVIGATGELVGFGGGLERKRSLLDLESPQLQLA
jgi:methylated-DNA-[protein]-cysteine S-methyltransferase